jgi:hypothetical protein
MLRQRTHPGPRLGRPKEQNVLREIVVSLLVAVGDCGGNLRFTSADETKGTLIPALQALRPVLPEKALPEKLPVATLNRIVSEYRARSRVSR